jgi:hypothetical protein
MTNFSHIQVGPQGFIITNKQKQGLDNLESNNRNQDSIGTIVELLLT